MSLGVGGSTTFSMASNHQTAANHAFREPVKFDPSKQTRVKCTSCGCWANRGEACPQCKMPTPAIIQKRNNNVKVEPAPTVRKVSVTSATAGSSPSVEKKTKPSEATTDQSATATQPRRASTTATTTTTDTHDDAHNALQHKFREEVKFDPAQQTKIKCCKCGCWAFKGQPCKLCKAVTTK